MSRPTVEAADLAELRLLLAEYRSARSAARRAMGLASEGNRPYDLQSRVEAWAEEQDGRFLDAERAILRWMRRRRLRVVVDLAAGLAVSDARSGARCPPAVVVSPTRRVLLVPPHGAE
jgi:hypothetical protein